MPKTRILKFFWWIFKVSIKILLISYITLIANRIYEDNYDKDHYITHQDFDKISKYRIPWEISKAKDCKAFFKWQENLVHPIFLYKPCPWAEYKDNRNIRLNGIWLSIPRRYLYGISKNLLDGVDDGALLDFKFPSLEPGIGKEAISVFLKLADKLKFDSKERVSKAEMFNIEYSMALGTAMRPYANLPQAKYKIIPIGYNENIKRNGYRIDEYDIDNDGKEYSYYNYVWTNDNPETSQDYIICPLLEDRPREHGAGAFYCKSMVYYHGFFATYDFRLKNLDQHDKIRKSLIQLLDKWRENYDKEEL